MPHSSSRNSAWRAKSLQRKVRAAEKQNQDFAQDTAHRMIVEANLTPLQIKRLEKSAAKIREQLKTAQPNWAELSSSEFLKLNK